MHFAHQKKILSTKSVNYDAKITRATDGIFTRPYKTANYKRLTSSKTYLNRDVRVLEEIKTERATYVKFSIGGKVIGYIDKNGLKLYESVRSTKSVKYGAIINTTTDGVFTAPYNTYGFKQLGFSSKYLTQYIDVSEEKNHSTSHLREVLTKWKSNRLCGQTSACIP